jgi:hypothetical protein
MKQHVIPISHLGGDGVHFIGYLMSQGISNFNVLHSSGPHDDNNNYIFVHGTYWDDTKDAPDIADKLFDYIEENTAPWNHGLQLFLENYNESQWSIQVFHNTIDRVMTNIHTHWNNFKKKTLVVSAATYEAHYHTFLLDCIKNDPLDGVDFLKAVEIRFGQLHNYDYNNQIYSNYNDVDVYYINYDALILNADYEEFVKIADYLDETVIISKDDFTDIVNTYHSKNNELIKRRNFAYNPVEMIEHGKKYLNI